MSQRKSKRKIATKNKSYSFIDSPFYKLQSKKKLCELLKTTPRTIKQLCDNSSSYNTFEVEGKNSKGRLIECPKDALDRVHTRIASLLCRIATPDFMHSGCKGRTHITNAKIHLGDVKVLTTDIKSFYASTTENMVFRLFYSKLKCSPDVSRLLAKLTTYRGHIPTGSRVSMPLALWANIGMFNEFQNLSDKHNVKMSVFVDDVTFSGNSLNELFISTVKKIAIKHLHLIHPDKTKLFKENEIKVITGVVLKGREMQIKNEQHLKIYQDIEAWKALQLGGVGSKSLNDRLLGRLNSLSQVDSRLKDKARSIREGSAGLITMD